MQRPVREVCRRLGIGFAGSSGIVSRLRVALLGLLGACVPGTTRPEAEAPTGGPLTQPAPAAWPGWVRLPAPPGYVDCTNAGIPLFDWDEGAEPPRPVQVRGRPSWVEPLPSPEPAELQVSSAGARRRVVRVADGWIVAMDAGEMGGGSYWLEDAGESKGAIQKLERLDASLADPVRWVGSTEFGVVGVAGLCHGTPHFLSAVFELHSRHDGGWQLWPTAVLRGCPGAISIGPGRESLLVAASNGVLYRSHVRDSPYGLERVTSEVAHWPEHLGPRQLYALRARGSAKETYYLSFGNQLARFEGEQVEWFVPAACIDFQVGSDGMSCQCVSAHAPSPAR